ncbi:hypothetical protein GCM10011531_02910 [Aquaticitalea lipolytica]|jgi:hypothetical protein|uniref:Uncharacterized protein n=1 Tax=Aquaticitalea lipolytica TaxID=1247562 RepID=A0A8J2TMX6_9FLAO|nr:DUF6090 family protein [Aquaticitalea lipolytica]GFZ77055.1 hypothetical protein GCM10011531_02910 [Aquaticitalea lipolytica]
MRLFRKIRHKQILDNKKAQYLKYALGEIILVVIGILIALQINNWNQSIKDKNSLNEYLIKIKSHTSQDQEQLEELVKGRKQIADLCKKARNSILDKTENDNLFLFMMSGTAFADFYFKPNSGGYESLKRSEYYGKLNNTKIDSLLARYHGLVDVISENEKSYNQYTVHQENYLDTQFDRSLILASAFMSRDSLAIKATPQSDYDQAFIEYTAKPAYRNVISLAAWQFDTMISQYNQLIELGHQIIKEIDIITED